MKIFPLSALMRKDLDKLMNYLVQLFATKEFVTLMEYDKYDIEQTEETFTEEITEDEMPFLKENEYLTAEQAK